MVRYFDLATQMVHQIFLHLFYCEDREESGLNLTAQMEETFGDPAFKKIVSSVTDNEKSVVKGKRDFTKCEHNVRCASHTMELAIGMNIYCNHNFDLSFRTSLFE